MSHTARLRWSAVVLLLLLSAGFFLLYLVTRERAGNTLVTTGKDAPRNEESGQVLVGRAYVGTQACAECHADRHATYRDTAHSRSFSEVNVAEEPEPGGFVDTASGRRYEVRHVGDKILHRESLDADQTVECEHVVRYLVGSGRHTRTYLIDDAGFLAESPITWYQSRRAWGLSPGYEKSNQGFERGADVGCLFCHTGRVETVDGSDTRLVIHEHAIGCEQCHGPGESHVKKYRAGGSPANTGSAIRSAQKHKKEFDETVIHPGKLSRPLAEAICANCHRTGEAMVLARGKQVADFRPGSPISHHRIDYRLDTGSAGMKVVGHVEQMHLSRCYQKTTTLTCTTCHDPHEPIAADKQSAHYRQKCLACHTTVACGLKEEDRRRADVQDDCTTCHMPTTKTDILHVAFRHHRIGVHQPDEMKPDEQVTAGAMVPFDDLSQWPESEREQFLGRAYFELLGQTAWEPSVRVYRARAQEILERCRERGDADGDTLAALAKLKWEKQDASSLDIALEALSAKDIFWVGRQTALQIVGREFLRRDQPSRAIEPLEQLVKLRRHSDDWTLLGISRAKDGDLQGAVDAVRRAVEIQPFRADVRRVRAEILSHAGDLEGAARQSATADILSIGPH